VPVWIVPTLNSGALIGDQTMQLAVLADLQKALRIQKDGGPSLVPAVYRAGMPMPTDMLFPTVPTVVNWLEAHRGHTLSVDIECTYHGQIMCVGLWCVDEDLEDQGVCIPFYSKGGTRYWNNLDELRVKEALFGMLKDVSWPKIGQNFVGFDVSKMEEAWGVKTLGVVGDTMLAHWCVMPELPHGLAFLSSIFTDLSPYKLEVHTNESEKDDVDKWESVQEYDDRNLREYCQQDTFATSRTWHSLVAMMDEYGVRQIHDHLAMPLIVPVQELGLKGLPFSTTIRDAKVAEVNKRLMELDFSLHASGITNANSPKQLNEDLLKLGVPLSKMTPSKTQYTVDLDVLGRIHHYYNMQTKSPKFPFLPELISRKRLEKARANLESLRPCLDGKLRTALRSTGTETGRYSSAGLRWCGVCKQPNHGTNLQNIAKNNKELGVNVKDCFVAPPGWVLWEIDYSMLELRIMAYLANVPKLISRMESKDGDVHKANTLALFDGRYDDKLRTLAKNFFYAMQYGGSEQAIQMALAKKGEYLDQDYIRGLLMKIYEEYPEIALWQQRENVECAAAKVKIVRNAFGGMRILLGSDPSKEWLSTRVQGTAGYIMSFSLLRMSEEVRRPIIANIHDAYLGMSPAERAHDDIRAVMQEMEYPVWLGDRFAVFPCDAKMGERWSDMKGVTL
jgi:DNA polymerase I